ncbi:MAG: hypothetical protein JG777_2972 [Clostridia bacterium]|nr:hypothetical protein [Clostridia bacterium]
MDRRGQKDTNRVAHDAQEAYGKEKRTFTGDFKLKVTSEALAGEKTIQVIAAENDISASLVVLFQEKILERE